MFRFAPLILLATLAALTLRAAAEAPSPLVVERYDAMIVVHELASEQRNWEIHRVYFIRDGKIIADRILTEDMLPSTDGPDFVLFWNDYGSCHRLVRSRVHIEFTVEQSTDFDSRGEAVPWWGMFRRMTDLAPPPEDE